MIPTTPADPLRQEIEQYAYFLYEQRGCQPGHELEDWLEAEKQLLNAMGVTNPTAIPADGQQSNLPQPGQTKRAGRKVQRIDVY